MTLEEKQQKDFRDIFNLLTAMNKLKPSIEENEILNLAREIYIMQSEEEMKNKLQSIFR